MKRKMKSLKYFVFLIVVAIFLSACSLTSGDKENIDPPQDVTYEEDLDVTGDGTTTDEANGEQAESVETELYLIDKNGYVVPRTFALPNTESVAKQALEYLVDGGEISNILPNDFRPVLPAGTEISVDITDGVATANFSNEFAEYAPEDEMKVLQSITWTLTQFDTVKSVKLKMNGNELSEMPVNGTPISANLTRNIGINLDTANTVDITNTHPVTVYYIAQTDAESYYVPVTKRVSNTEDNSIAAVVKELVEGPNIDTPLYSLFMSDVELMDEPKIDKGIVTLNFNENIYGSFDQKLIQTQVIEPLVLSLTEQEGIEGVAIQVNGEANLVNQNGEAITEPVTRPENVNTGSF